MLYLFHGTDTFRVADQANSVVASLRAKRPDASVYVFEGALIDPAPLDELIEARGLFVQKHIVVLKLPFETTDSRDMVLARVERLSVSENIFVLSEGKLLAEHKRVLEQYATKSEEHTKVVTQKRGFDSYGVASALKARNRRALWEGYLRTQRSGESAEAMCGLMHWAVKDMLQHPVRYSSKYTNEELVGMSRSLISLYHDAHRGIYDLDTALERWTLSV